jgi:hypothetical protein
MEKCVKFFSMWQPFLPWARSARPTERATLPLRGIKKVLQECSMEKNLWNSSLFVSAQARASSRQTGGGGGILDD